MEEDKITMTNEEIIKDYPRLKLEYTRLHEDYRRSNTFKKETRIEELETEIDRFKSIIQRKRNEKIDLYKKLAINEAEEMQLLEFVAALKELNKPSVSTE